MAVWDQAGAGTQVAAVRLRVAAVGALDRLGVVGAGSERDLDLPGFLLLGLGDPDLEHAAIEVGLDPVGVDSSGRVSARTKLPDK